MLTNSSWTNGRLQFRLWRQSRPFWGGLLLLVAGIELFFSANMDLGAIQFHLGPEGFLSYLLPVLLLVCGTLVWLTPNQRVFYAIVGTLTAVYALVGLNLGGFLLGTLIGMIGGGLAFAWSPDGSATTTRGTGPSASEEDEDDTWRDDESGDAHAGPRKPAPAMRRGRHQEDEAADDPYGPSGPVTGRHLDEPAPESPAARHRSNLAVSIGIPILITAAVAGTIAA